jgi:two-component system, NarL family, sensor histidine kinase UhpB
MRRFGERSILEKILAVNAAIILIGAVAGTLVTQRLSDQPWWVVALAFFAGGVCVTALANYLILRTAFRPLIDLSTALSQVHKGERQGLVPEGGQEPSLRSVSEAVVEMLDRLEGESRRYTAKMFETIEDERRRIGRELHDDTSQTLAAALINLELIQKGCQDGGTEVGKRVENTIDLIQYCLTQIKVLVYDLRPAMLDDLGLVPALRWYIQSHLEGSGLEVVTDLDPGRQRLPEEVETALYRVAQESLGNVVRHSLATEVKVSLETGPDFVSLTVADNGIGFVPEEVINDDAGRFGIGLLSIKERAELLHGTVAIDSSPGKGTRVSVVVPLEEVEAA